MIPVEELSKAVTQENPAGAQGDVGFLTHLYEEARKSAGKPMVDGEVAEEEEPPWTTLQNFALRYLRESKDIRAVWTLMIADAQDPRDEAGTLASVSQGLQLCRVLLESFWDTVHPVADDKARDNFNARMEAVEMFGNNEVLTLTDKAPVIAPGLPGIPKETLGGALKKLAPNSPDAPQIQGLLAVSAEEHPAFLEMIWNTINGCLHELDGIAGLLQREVKVSPKFAPLRSRLHQYRKILAPYVTAGLSYDTDAEAENDASHVTAETVPLASITNRTEVLQWLDAMIHYLHRNEPGSPVNLLLQRARRMVPMSFVELMNELQSNFFDTFKGVLGSSDSALPPPVIDTEQGPVFNPVVISSRDDVIRGFNLITKFYEHHEPGSFLLVVLQRAKQMIGVNFTQLLAALKPDSVSLIHGIFGKF